MRTLPCALVVVLSLAALAVSQPAATEDPRAGRPDADHPALVYLVVDLKRDSVAAGPFYIPLEAMPPRTGHVYRATYKELVATSDGVSPGREVKFDLVCQVLRETEDVFVVQAAVESLGRRQATDLRIKASECECGVLRPQGPNGRYIFVYSICRPIEPSAVMGP